MARIVRVQFIHCLCFFFPPKDNGRRDENKTKKETRERERGKGRKEEGKGEGNNLMEKRGRERERDVVCFETRKTLNVEIWKILVANTSHYS